MNIQMSNAHKMMPEYNKSSDEVLFSIERVSRTVPKSSRYYHFHDRYEIYYLYSGERYYFVKDKTYHIKSGTIVLINAYDVHYTQNCAKHGYDRHLLQFKKEFIGSFVDLCENKDVLNCFEDDVCTIKLSPKDQHYVETLLEKLQEENDFRKENHQICMQTLLLQLLIFINRNKGKVNESEVDYLNAFHKTISEITAYINNNYQSDITLSNIAKKYFVSEAHLSRTFKKYTGFTFVEYLNGIRVKEARDLLKKSDKTVYEVAELVGYNSPTHFGRVFKSITGISPVTYKKINCICKKEN